MGELRFPFSFYSCSDPVTVQSGTIYFPSGDPVLFRISCSAIVKRFFFHCKSITTKCPIFVSNNSNYMIRKSFLVECGFEKQYPLGYEGDDNVCYFQLVKGGLTFISFRNEGDSDFGVLIYESENQTIFTNEDLLTSFLNILSVTQTYSHFMCWS